MKKYKHGLQDDIGYWLSRLRTKVHSSFEAKITNANVTLPQWCILISLYNNDASSIVELANFIEVDKGSISRVVDKLEAAGYVTRQAGKDRRSAVLLLTKKGQETAPKLAKLAELNEEEYFSCLSPLEKKQLKKLLKKLLQHAGVKSLGGWFAK